MIQPSSNPEFISPPAEGQSVEAVMPTGLARTSFKALDLLDGVNPTIMRAAGGDTVEILEAEESFGDDTLEVVHKKEGDDTQISVTWTVPEGDGRAETGYYWSINNPSKRWVEHLIVSQVEVKGETQEVCELFVQEELDTEQIIELGQLLRFYQSPRGGDG